MTDSRGIQKKSFAPWLAAGVALLGAAQGAAAAVSERDVTYPNGEIELAAALLLPEGAGPFPAAVLVQGSGDSDRTNLWARSWAEALADRGIVALLTDKRGSGQSGGDWHTVGYEVLAGDALAGVEFLAGLPEVAAGAVGVIGLSQGGFVAPVAAVLSDRVAFVVAISAAATQTIDQVNHEMRNTFRQAGLDAAGVEAGMRLQGLAVQYLRTGDWESYATALREAAASPLAPVAAGFPQSQDSWVWEFWRQVGDFDPLDYWRRLHVPGLVMYGEDDEQDNVPVAASVRRLEELTKSRDLTVRVFPGSGHALRDPEPSASRSLRADATQLLVEWIVARAASY
jgi:uncharacterized protein